MAYTPFKFPQRPTIQQTLSQTPGYFGQLNMPVPPAGPATQNQGMLPSATPNAMPRNQKAAIIMGALSDIFRGQDPTQNTIARQQQFMVQDQMQRQKMLGDKAYEHVMRTTGNENMAILARENPSIALQTPEYKIQQLRDGNYYYVDPTGNRPPMPVSTNITPKRDEKTITDLENQLRDEFTDGSGEYIKVRDAYARVDAAGKDPSAAGDLALIFNYMKMLDPGSTVREGEFANAQNSAGVPARIRAKFNQVQSGQRLDKPTRKDFLDRADMLYRAAFRGQKQLVKTYTGLAERNNVNVDNVVIDYESSVSDIAFANQIKNMALSELQNYDKSDLSEKQKNILDEIIKIKMVPDSNAGLTPNTDVNAILEKYRRS